MKLKSLLSGKMVGHFSNPRSDSFEEKNGVKLSSYKGDNVNGDTFDAISRTPDPHRMVRVNCQSGYSQSLMDVCYWRLCCHAKGQVCQGVLRLVRRINFLFQLIQCFHNLFLDYMKGNIVVVTLQMMKVLHLSL
ncbi:unnamed protein product [Vicia faba]|uniref:Phospho-2-dehydro-3-deoxyheptonate aldolase n=1 Tax=Vicia faba TaxID=3906 RepID=A0AAV0Z408_VICFA|nr:unnamed protein product [Vicia faba]